MKFHRSSASNTGSKRPSRVGGPALSSQKSSTAVHFAVPCPTGLVQNIRKGLFYASDLTESNEAKQFQKEFPDLDKQCIIRFPQKYAAILRSRLQEAQEQDANLKQGHTSGRAGLGLTITPTAKEDYRIFNISIEESVLGGVNDSGEEVMLKTQKHLIGILVELPCIIESYKTFDGDLFFKSSDVSQMIYVYDPLLEDPDLEKLKNESTWEWHSGITPPTYRIRTRKFRNFEVFEKGDIQMGERELLELIRGYDRDSVMFETVSSLEMNSQLQGFRSGCLSAEPNVTFVVGPDDNIFDDEACQQSDFSDRLFMDEYDDAEDAEDYFAAEQGDGAEWGGYKLDECGNVVRWLNEDGPGSSSSGLGESSASDTDRKKKRREEKKQRKEKRRRKREKKKRLLLEQQQMQQQQQQLSQWGTGSPEMPL